MDLSLSSMSTNICWSQPWNKYHLYFYVGSHTKALYLKSFLFCELPFSPKCVWAFWNVSAQRGWHTSYLHSHWTFLPTTWQFEWIKTCHFQASRVQLRDYREILKPKGKQSCSAQISISFDYIAHAVLYCQSLCLSSECKVTWKRAIFWKVARLMSTAMAVLITRGNLSSSSESSKGNKHSWHHHTGRPSICYIGHFMKTFRISFWRELTKHALSSPGVVIPGPYSVLDILWNCVGVHVSYTAIHWCSEICLTCCRCSNDISHLRFRKMKNVIYTHTTVTVDT